jgi:hypothetical protein
MSTIRQYAVAILIAVTSLFTGCTRVPVERVTVELCTSAKDSCYLQDVPAVQFVGKPYILVNPHAFRWCDLADTEPCPATVTAGNRQYFLNPSEVTK